jgi:pimeloyl-ACP methyl ester carboxylesterase
LAKAGVTGRLILVGHSYGGFLVRMYAARYPTQAAGLVLVDPNTVSFFERQPHVVPKVHAQSRLLRLAAPLGLVRLLVAGEFRRNMRFPDREKTRQMLEVSLTTKHLEAQARMLEAFGRTVESMRAVDTSPDLPLIVISRGKPESSFPWEGDTQREADWRSGHQELVRSIAQATLIRAEESDHMVPFDQPDLVVRAVNQLVSQARHPAP